MSASVEMRTTAAAISLVLVFIVTRFQFAECRVHVVVRIATTKPEKCGLDRFVERKTSQRVAGMDLGTPICVM